MNRILQRGAVQVAEAGAANTTAWRMFFEAGKAAAAATATAATPAEAKVSPWHNLELPASAGGSGLDVVQYVNEIPRGTRAKMEICTTEEHNPIKQDTKKGELRFYKYGDMPFNYGALPRTWEDPEVPCEACNGAVGDNDPLDVVDLGAAAYGTGEVVAMRPLGVLALIDEGETDWKIVTLPDTEEYARFTTLASLRNDEAMNKRLAECLHWFRYYKTADGKPENSFGFNGEFQDECYARKVIEEAAQAYNKLIEEKAARGSRGLWLS
eukprot:Rhum_TRINITY_DN10257_c0_g1::Rhum_TRINITY_DN10257_c0_g1_i1::g.37565::m.37565/K01507/ppa; inorganic pyrophosphatase